MSSNNPETSLETHLRRISKVVQNWPGEPLDPWSSLRVLNESGTKPPLFWCFNSAGEFPALARTMGPDQPVVGMRSLNQILEREAISPQHSRELGEYYAQKLFERFGQVSCIIGGNCQAAPISYAIALWMKSHGVRVRHLVTLDAELNRPYPGEIRMLFGRNSHVQNPFFGVEVNMESPKGVAWRYAISMPKPKIVDGGHGEYFSPDNVSNLAQAICAPSKESNFKPPQMQLPNWRIVSNDDQHVVVASPQADWNTSQFAIVPIWEQAAYQHRLSGDDWIAYPKQSDADFICSIKKPDFPGESNLRLVICLRDQGPIDWPLAKFQNFKFCK